MPGLFSSTTFNNGVAHAFVERGQMPDPKSIVREYIEPAAPAASMSKLTVKHDLNVTKVKRSLLQRRVLVAGSDGVLAPITVNFTVTASPKHAAADIILEILMVKAAISDTTFNANFVNGLS